MDLRLPWCGIGADGTVLILQSLSTTSALKGLDLSGSIFDSEGVNLLGKYLHTSQKVMLTVIKGKWSNFGVMFIFFQGNI